jgi:hypothetical protein
MAIRGVFQAGGLLSGLGSTGTKLKEVQQRSKSTSTEMKRMTNQSNLLSKSLAAIGIAGFSALLMTTPQLAGALAKIKSEMQRIAWSIGKHLKPALDAVATILRGIRTGDWSVIQKGISDLTNSIWNLVKAAGSFVLDVVFGEGTAEKVAGDFSRWLDKLTTAWEEGDVFSLMGAAIEPVIWALERLWNAGIKIGNWLKTDAGKFAIGQGIIGAMPGGQAAIGIGGFIGRSLGEGQTGLNVPRTGMYKLHAGETVTMRGSTPHGGATNEIILDFSGANINLSSGIGLNDFADAISNKIAERQSNLTY